MKKILLVATIIFSLNVCLFAQKQENFNHIGLYTMRIGKMENDLELPPSNIFPINILLFSLSALRKVYTLTLFIYCFP